MGKTTVYGEIGVKPYPESKFSSKKLKNRKRSTSPDLAKLQPAPNAVGSRFYKNIIESMGDTFTKNLNNNN